MREGGRNAANFTAAESVLSESQKSPVKRSWRKFIRPAPLAMKEVPMAVSEKSDKNNLLN